MKWGFIKSKNLNTAMSCRWEKNIAQITICIVLDTIQMLIFTIITYGLLFAFYWIYFIFQIKISILIGTSNIYFSPCFFKISKIKLRKHFQFKNIFSLLRVKNMLPDAVKIIIFLFKNQNIVQITICIVLDTIQMLICTIITYGLLSAFYWI